MCGIPTEAPLEGEPEVPVSFTDVHEGDYFYSPVLWAVRNNITVGTSATTFSPSQTCNPGPDRHLPVQALRISGAKALRSPLRPSPEGAFLLAAPGDCGFAAEGV